MNDGQGKGTPSYPVFRQSMNDWQPPDGQQIGEQNEGGEPDLNELLERSRIHYENDYPIPPSVLSIVGEGGEFIPFASLGDFCVITGKAKSKKTFLISLLLGTVLIFDPLQGFIKCDLPPGKRGALWFDTEQSNYHISRVYHRIAKLAGVKPASIEVFGLRQYGPLERIALINHALEQRKGGGIGLVIIDGIRDLVFDINDPKESTECVQWLMKWTKDYNLHIVTVLHQNKNDNNARGHLGTEAVNKCQAAISVTRDKEDKKVSIVEPEDTRGPEFTPFAFRITDTGLPEIMTDYELKRPGEKKKTFDPYDYPETSHRDILRNVFNGRNLPRGEFDSGLAVEWLAVSVKLTSQARRDLITYYTGKMKWVKHNGGQGKAVRYSYNEH